MIRVLFNKKGGVGKSSLTVNLAAIAAKRGLNTLLIDLDTQCNATSYLDMLGTDNEENIAELFDQTITFHLRKRPAEEFCLTTKIENLSIIAGSPRLSELESELHSRHKIFKLREALDTLRDTYDCIFIDTAPALNFFSLSALIAADSCLIPIDCDDFARQGLYQLHQDIAEIQEDHNDKLRIEGIIANQFMLNARLPKRIIEELTQEQYPVIPIPVPQSVKMRESHELKSPLCQCAPKHKLTKALEEMFDYLLTKSAA